MDSHELTLREEVVLLSLDDKKGTFHNSQAIPVIVAGALLMELDARGRVALEDGFLVTVDGEPTGDALLDELLGLLTASTRRKRARAWVRVIPTKLKKLHDRVALQLVDRGILKETEGKVLWVFPVTRYPERRRVPEREVLERIRRAVAGSRQLDPDTGRLAALVAAGKMSKRVFEPHQRRDGDRRIKALVKSEAFKKIVGETAREIHDATAKAVEASGGS